jgi:hypothetical protein
VLETYRGRVEAWFCGYHPPELAGRADVHNVDYIKDYDAFFRTFAGAGFDIGLAPLPDEAFYRSKSDNKFREYAAAGIAGIYSDMVVYRDCVDHGRTGWLVSDAPGGWYAAMARLIEDDDLRLRIQREAPAHARSRYGVRQTAETWMAQIRAVWAEARGKSRSTESPAARPSSRTRAAAVRARRLVRQAAATVLRRRRPDIPAFVAGLEWEVQSMRALMRLQRELRRSP